MYDLSFAWVELCTSSLGLEPNYRNLTPRAYWAAMDRMTECKNRFAGFG